MKRLQSFGPWSSHLHPLYRFFPSTPHCCPDCPPPRERSTLISTVTSNHIALNSQTSASSAVRLQSCVEILRRNLGVMAMQQGAVQGQCSRRRCVRKSSACFCLSEGSYMLQISSAPAPPPKTAIQHVRLAIQWDSGSC